VLEIIEVREPGRVRVRGELDMSGAPALDEVLHRLRERGELILLDLDELEFIDMSGLRVVLAAAEQRSGEGGAFAVTRGSQQVRRLLGLVGLDGQLHLDGGLR
jgi:anti-anti-sigma factor